MQAERFFMSAVTGMSCAKAQTGNRTIVHLDEEPAIRRRTPQRKSHVCKPRGETRMAEDPGLTAMQSEGYRAAAD